MVHMIGGKLVAGKGPHVPEEKIVMNVTRVVHGVPMTIKTGIESVEKDRWRAFYSPLLNPDASRTYLTAPPGGLSIERARTLAIKAGELLVMCAAVALDQITDDQTKMLLAKEQIDTAVKGAG
jgi:hypothetical protein